MDNSRRLMYEKIRELEEMGLNISQIARRLQVSRNTIYNYINSLPEKFEKENMERRKKLDEYHNEILSFLENYSDVSAQQVLHWLKEQLGEVDVSPSTVSNYVRWLRTKHNIPKYLERE